MNQQVDPQSTGAQPPEESAQLIASLERIRLELAATVQEIQERYADRRPVDGQGQRLLRAAISDLEDLDSRMHDIRNQL